MKMNNFFINMFFTTVVLSLFLLPFISCGNLLNKNNPQTSSAFATALGISYTGDSGGSVETPAADGAGSDFGSIEKASDGIYKFNESTSGNVTSWISNNNGVNNSTATSTWNITVNSSCTLTVDFEVSSESNRDKFSLRVDNTAVLTNVSGNVSNTVSRALTAGVVHTVTATYTKDSSGSSGSDRVSLRFALSD